MPIGYIKMKCPRCKSELPTDPPNYEYWCFKCGHISIEEMHNYFNKGAKKNFNMDKISEKIKKEITDFLNQKDKMWFCPIIKCFCEKTCYSYETKGFYLLEKRTRKIGSSWSPNFKTLENFEEYFKKNHWSIEEFIEIRFAYSYCKLLDALQNINLEE